MYRLLVLPGGALVAVGDFQLVGSLPVAGFAQLAADGVLGTLPKAAPARTEAWPVPAYSVLHVALDATAKPRQVTLVDLLGRVVVAKETTGSYVQLDVSALPTAPYLLRVRYEQQTTSKRILVE